MNLSNVNTAYTSLIKGINKKISNVEVKPLGDSVPLKATKKNHYNFQDFPKGDSLSFGDYLKRSIMSTNQSIVGSEKLSQQMMTDPTSVAIEDVTIAAKEAEVSLNLSKSVINKLISGYKELINIR